MDSLGDGDAFGALGTSNPLAYPCGEFIHPVPKSLPGALYLLPDTDLLNRIGPLISKQGADVM